MALVSFKRSSPKLLICGYEVAIGQPQLVSILWQSLNLN